ncbi:TonB-dependent receptor [Aquamicrobium sp. LC103]|uniref:TonB-dependent receptor n=1 Tax=Aquamicrobium sp. LC103 TaxID=1120658 RepID=UPI00063E7CF4|nr:TonB-dependent receptor [Aquamicrobium sp. LC103]TKT76182.1 TonB-dependent receptor [Aquamicrobium sp. LC103]
MTKGFGGRVSARAGVRIGGLGLALLASTAICASLAIIGPAQAQQASATLDYSVPAGPLGTAISRFGDSSDLQVLYPADLVRNKRSPGVSGSMTREEALSRLLSGTGLTYRFTSAGTVTLGDSVSSAHAPANADGSLLLDVINVTGRGGVSAVDTPYETAAPAAHIPQETIERFRGGSPADMFRGTAGVMSGEARNGAGSIDVNIRGMQGMGRVAVTVDGAENATTVYQGYQGLSNRTFVDPDLLAGVDIIKGSDVASNGIAGTVAMRTLDAGDIVEEGRKFGMRLKGGFGTNTSKPKDGAVAGYSYRNTPNQVGVATPSADGMDRPPFLEPTSGSGSLVAAFKEENFDLIAGYAYRKQGNYHAGTHGPHAEPVWTGPRPDCYSSGVCMPWNFLDYVENGGIANYRAGEEVLNTQLETESWITKGTIRFGDGQSLQLGYNGFRSEAGDRLASRLTGDTGQAIQQAQTVGTQLDTGTLRYRWNPDGNDLVDLKANLWFSRLEMRNPLRSGWMPPKPGDFRSGSDTNMWGTEVTNLSKLDTGYGPLDLTYGLSYRGEDTRPSPGTREAETWLDLRDGIRHEAAGFAKAAWKPVDWLTFNGGLRYQHYWSQDRNDPFLDRDYDYDASFNDGGLSPALGVTIEPFDGAQLYVNYSNAMRSPSIMETVSAFSMEVNSSLKPERSSNWEIGTNLRRDGLFRDDDRGMLKLGYFNWDVKDYIGREWHQSQQGWWGMHIFNMDRARFSGLELSGRYEIGGFTAELSANYYLDVEFCRTADTCENKSLYADYATNHVPPEYSVDLTLSQKFMEDALTLGGRVSHVGPRAIGHGDATAQGASQFIALIDWKPYTLVDVFAEYQINDNLKADFRIQNLTDQFYVDPLSLVLQPGPGRSFHASLTARF